MDINCRSKLWKSNMKTNCYHISENRPIWELAWLKKIINVIPWSGIISLNYLFSKNGVISLKCWEVCKLKILIEKERIGQNWSEPTSVGRLAQKLSNAKAQWQSFTPHMSHKLLRTNVRQSSQVGKKKRESHYGCCNYSSLQTAPKKKMKWKTKRKIGTGMSLNKMLIQV